MIRRLLRAAVGRVVGLWLRVELWAARRRLDPSDPLDAFALGQLEGTVYRMDREDDS